MAFPTAFVPFGELYTQLDEGRLFVMEVEEGNS